MSYPSDAGLQRAFTHAPGRGLSSDWGPSGPPAQPQRDIKKLFLVVGLGALSWVATYVGMLELIEANMGDLPLVHKAIIGFSVAMLMTMIIWLLDQMFAPVGLATKLCYVAGYLFLTIISVGFGFGFYWKVLESRSESSRSAEAAVTQVQGSLHAASTRLEQLDATLVQLAAVSREKAELERTKGTSCPNSKPGDGPRRKMRDEDASRFSFASELVKGRVEAVKTEMTALNADLAKIASADKSTFDAKTGTRNEFMKALSRKLDMTVTGFNAFRTDPQLKQLRTDLSDRSDKSTFGDPRSGGFVCPDPQLQQALKGAVRAIDQLPELKKPEIAAVEGSEATIEAFRRLTATFYGLLSFKLPPSADELRELQKRAVQSVETSAPTDRLQQPEGGGLSKRDYVPLAVAIFVYICLLLVSIGRPMNRLHGLVPKMREAERGPVIEILSRFNDIHRDREVRESFELFRHVVFDLNGDYYVAVPLDAPPRMNPQQREQLRLEAQLLANLFASFEKERIFTRTWTPFTGKVQKKLRRQGSKFADAEAFRVYRFRKGAWSEIILGAVMGAARRADDEKRRRGLMETSALVVPRDPPFSRGDSPRERTAPVRPPMTAHDVPAEDARASLKVANGPIAFPGRRVMRNPADREWDRHTAAGTAAKPAPEAAESPPARFSGFGSYARSARAELEQRAPDALEAPIAVPANSNTAPAAEAKPATMMVVRQPATCRDEAASAESSAAAETGIDLVLRRETVTIPLSEAALQSRLPSLLARAASQGDGFGLTTERPQPAAEPEAESGSEINSILALPDRSAAIETVDSGARRSDSAKETGENDWSETDVTLVRRFKPEAAE